jgi:hypothetical protein
VLEMMKCKIKKSGGQSIEDEGMAKMAQRIFHCHGLLSTRRYRHGDFTSLSTWG